MQKKPLFLRLFLACIIFTLASLHQTIFATRSGARESALIAARALAAYGFDYRDSYTYGTLDEGEYTVFKRRLYRGNTYALVAGGCEYTRDVDIYVYDYQGDLISYDRDSDKSAVATFNSRYTGTYYIAIKMYDSTSDGVHWCLVYGYK